MANIIEPCCAERQLGQLLREAHGQAALFQTHGDVTAKLFIKDTMLLSGDRPRTLTIAASEMPQEAMRLVGRYAQLGYIATLRLMVHESAGSGLHPAFLDCNVELALLPDDQPIPELMMWQGATGIVAIQGDMPDTVDPTLHLYAGIMGGLQSLNVHAAIDPFNALFRARRVEIEQRTTADEHGQAEQEEQRTTADSTDGATVVSDLVADNTPETKKTRKTKKTKDDDLEHNQVVEGAQAAEA